MSNNKSTNGNSRQMTLPQMTLALANNNKASQQGNNGSNKKKPVSIVKANPSNTINKKPQIHEIINLEQ